MATREENLKKINAELEQLSDEELEKIAGGALRNLNPQEGINPAKISSEALNNTNYGKRFGWK